MADHPVVFGLCAEMIADPHHAGRLLGRGPGQVDRGQASGVGLDRPGARRHGAILAADGADRVGQRAAVRCPMVAWMGGTSRSSGRGRAVASGGRFVGGQVKRGAGAVYHFTTSGGAGESGLARLVHVQFLTAAGDATVAVSLAGTLFFTLPTDQARPQVAQFLLLTMAPFAIVAPFIGPFLDRSGTAGGGRSGSPSPCAVSCAGCWPTCWTTRCGLSPWPSAAWSHRRHSP